ncbi:hypothetical protein [Thermus thermamylovorans]|uniref:Uncharacterized protein n=1 Tax=Thermus thermamylovorans TaxID=2509362 RepID=A0A4Q9B934_9DEIN|nr:hypothetical protein [Thermus thermamylovorans]TBH21848.1 hypothetical protein ETP66_01000 [Thermus thermamylovorans]
MSLENLLALLFLLFFIVIPTLQSLTRRGQPLPPPDLPPDLPEPEPPPRPRPQARPRPRPAAPPPPPPPPAPTWASREGESLEGPGVPERTRLEVRFREELREEPQEPSPERKPRRAFLGKDWESILRGVVWHEVLKRPKGF